MKKILGLTFAGLGILTVAFLPRILRACAWPSVELIFINTVHPDLPIEPYTHGNLGVIQPTYGGIYLYVAYRNLVGRPIQPSEQEALWQGDERITSPQSVQVRDSDVGSAKTQSAAPVAPIDDFWRRDQVFREVAIHENGTEFYSQFLNCPQDTFSEANKTLKMRTQQFGEKSPIVQEWIDAQQMVFRNCMVGPEIPEELPPTAPAIARADRAYQQAAAYFYAGLYDEAIGAFRAIAKDTSSPWSTIAPYLVARALVRKATLTDKTEPDFATLAQAEKQTESVIADPRLAPYHHAAERLRGFIEFRLHPGLRLVELGNNLMQGSKDANLAQDVIDFKRLLAETSFENGPPQVRGEAPSGSADIRARSDLVDWMLTFRSLGPETYSHSLEKWKTTQSSAWLVAALTNAEPGSPKVSELLTAAAQVSPRSPAYDSVTFQSMRLMLLQGKNEEVRERLAQSQIHRMGVLSPDFNTPPSTVNLILALRFELAQNFDELLENAARVPATITDDLSSQQLPEPDGQSAPGSFDEAKPWFDDDSLVVLNRLLPVAMLAEAARSPKLTAKLRHDVALAAWTRAALLGNSSAGQSLAPQVKTFEPKLIGSIQIYNSAATPEAQRFAAAFTALRFPGLSPFITTPERFTPIDEIDSFRGNWWGQSGPPCSVPDEWSHSSPVLRGIYPGGKVKPPGFLTAKERSEAEQELRQLNNLGPAPDYLPREVIDWAKTHPSDPRVAEALALAVKSTRFGCTDQKTGQFSKQAFDLLHSRYPKSSWAQQTKYWFK